jgi:hypothetical protein
MKHSTQLGNGESLSYNVERTGNGIWTVDFLVRIFRLLRVRICVERWTHFFIKRGEALAVLRYRFFHPPIYSLYSITMAVPTFSLAERDRRGT